MVEHPSDEPVDLVPFRIARTPFEARVIAAVLEGAGIPAMTPGGLLADEFALSQRLMNLQNVQVLVPRARLVDAEAALRDSREIGREGDVDWDVDPRDGERETLVAAKPASSPRSHLVWATLATVAALLSFAMWLDAFSQLQEVRRLSTPLTVGEVEGDRVVHRRIGDGSLAWLTIDADQDGIPEEQRVYDRRGKLRYAAYDRDENFIYERADAFNAAEDLVSVSEDPDQDHLAEIFRCLSADGSSQVHRDTDGDGRHDTVEILDRKGELVLRQVLDPVRGYVTR